MIFKTAILNWEPSNEIVSDTSYNNVASDWNKIQTVIDTIMVRKWFILCQERLEFLQKVSSRIDNLYTRKKFHEKP
jgi:hypothetical protein